MKTLITLICALAALNSPALAQSPGRLLSTDASAFGHQVTLKDGITEIRYRQLVSPLSISIPLAHGRLNVQGGYMYVDVEDSTFENDLSGPLDTQISGEWNLGRALFTAYANLPTGLDSLEANEASLTRDIARNDLNFPVKSFGHGLDFGGALTVAHQMGRWAASVGAGYVMRGAYAPLVGVSDYDPGDEITVTGGLSYSVDGWTVGMDASGTMIRVDRLDGAIVFRNGKQFTAGASLSYESRLLRMDASIVDIVRLKNRQVDQGALLYEDRDSNGNDLRADGRLDLRPVSGITLFAEAHYKNISKNAYAPGNSLYQGAARLWSYGGGVSVKIGTTEALTVRVTKGDGWINDRAQDAETLNARVSVRLFF